MAVFGPQSLRPPRLRVRDDLIKARPELADLLKGQESRLPSGLASKAKNAQVNMTSTAGRSLLAGSLLEEEVSEEEQLRRELEMVKQERSHLLKQLMLVRTDTGKAGGDLQQEDIEHLRMEVEIKKAKLNAIHEDIVLKDKEMRQLILISQDCALLMPDGSPEAQASLERLQEAHKALDTDLAEAEAKHMLYTLLEARTKRELQAMTNQVAASQQLQEAYKEDEASLLLHLHAVKAALEDAIKEKNRVNRHFEATREDWTQKLQDRQREVRDLQRRQQEDAAREERQLKQIADKEAAEREKKAKLRMQEEAFALQLEAMQPKLEALEEAWGRLHSITGADTPEALIAFWKGNKLQEESMLELARTAEQKQREAQQQLQGLLEERSKMLEETDQNLSSNSQQEETSSERLSGHHAEERLQRQKMVEAERRAATAKKQFGRLRDVCIGAQQGLYALNSRLESALAKVEGKQGLAGDSRRASESRTRRTGSILRAPKDGLGGRNGSMEVATGPKLLRLYTVTQDEFFPDLLPLVQSSIRKVQTVMGLVSKLPGGEALEAAGPAGNATKPVKLSSMRRRTWTGPPWSLPDAGGALARVQQKPNARVDLSKLVGYTADAPLSSAEATEEEDKNGEWDGIINRQIIKNRTARVLQRHKAATAPKPIAKK